MPITNVHIAINRHLRSLTVENKASGAYINGEYAQVIITGTKELAIFPVTRRDLQFLPEGEYTFQDKKLYEIGSGTIEDKSIIHFDDSIYIVDGGTRRNFEGGYTTYLAKRDSSENDNL